MGNLNFEKQPADVFEATLQYTAEPCQDEETQHADWFEACSQIFPQTCREKDRPRPTKDNKAKNEEEKIEEQWFAIAQDERLHYVPPKEREPKSASRTILKILYFILCVISKM